MKNGRFCLANSRSTARNRQIPLAGSSLEQILNIGGGCGWPNLDLLAKSDDGGVAVESKCTDYFKSKAPSQRPSDLKGCTRASAATLQEARTRPRRGFGPVALYDELAMRRSQSANTLEEYESGMRVRPGQGVVTANSPATTQWSLRSGSRSCRQAFNSSTSSGEASR